MAGTRGRHGLITHAIGRRSQRRAGRDRRIPRLDRRRACARDAAVRDGGHRQDDALERRGWFREGPPVSGRDGPPNRGRDGPRLRIDRRSPDAVARHARHGRLTGTTARGPGCGTPARGSRVASAAARCLSGRPPSPASRGPGRPAPAGDRRCPVAGRRIGAGARLLDPAPRRGSGRVPPGAPCGRARRAAAGVADHAAGRPHDAAGRPAPVSGRDGRPVAGAPGSQAVTTGPHPPPCHLRRHALLRARARSGSAAPWGSGDTGVPRRSSQPRRARRGPRRSAR